MKTKAQILILNAVSLIGLILVVFFIKNGIFEATDIFINQTIPKIASKSLDTFMFIFTTFGDWYLLGPLFGLIFLYLLFKKDYTKAATVFITSSSGIALGSLIKLIFERARPENARLVEHTFSFPSGHATLSTIFFLIIIYIFKAKPLTVILASLFALTVSFSRIYFSVHYLSDIFGGIFLGLFCFTLGLNITSVFFQKPIAKLTKPSK